MPGNAERLVMHSSKILSIRALEVGSYKGARKGVSKAEDGAIEIMLSFFLPHLHLYALTLL